MFNLHVQRLNRLPIHRNEVWQGGVMPIGMFNGESVPDPLSAFKVSPYQGPYVGYWLSLLSAHSYTSSPEAPHVDPCVAAVNALVQFASDPELAGYRPGKVVVSDKKIAAYLRSLLVDAEVEVELAGEMQMVEALLPLMGMNTIDEVLESMSAQMQEVVDMRTVVPPAVTGYKVTHQHLARFAEAAQAFYETRPWEYADSLFLIRIDEPRAPRRLKYATLILDENNEPGIALFSSRKQYQAYYLGEDIETWGSNSDCWQMTFDAQERMPPGDVTAWQLYGWPLPHINAYPFVIKLDPTGTFTRPPESVLVYLEGLLRAIAKVDINQLMSEPMSVEVSTFAGAVTYNLSMHDQTLDFDLPETSPHSLKMADYIAQESQED
jgi:hypothetical protein